MNWSTEASHLADIAQDGHSILFVQVQHLCPEVVCVASCSQPLIDCIATYHQVMLLLHVALSP